MERYIPVAQARPKPPKMAVLGTTILSHRKGHFGPTGPEYSGRTKPKWSVLFDVPTEISGILG